MKIGFFANRLLRAHTHSTCIRSLRTRATVNDVQKGGEQSDDDDDDGDEKKKAKIQMHKVRLAIG